MNTSALRAIAQPCTIRYWSAGPADDRGDPTDEYVEVETMCVFQQRSRTELGDGQVSNEVWWVYMAADERLPAAADLLFVDGVTYEFHGNAWLAKNLRGQADHIEATCGRGA